jgi:uncharacterized protein YdeI (YjbR/CyaY-like superfamily)
MDALYRSVSADGIYKCKERDHSRVTGALRKRGAHRYTTLDVAIFTVQVWPKRFYTIVQTFQERTVSSVSTFNPQVDAYIGKAKPYAQPILMHIRELVHKACPGVVEAIKWSRPFFEYKGAILCNMSAFKEHCTLGFWGVEISKVLREAKVLQPDAMGSLGRLTRVEDLPADKKMLEFLRKAVGFIDSGQYTSPIAARPKVAKVQAPPAPAEFTRALKANKAAAAAFAAFSPSCKKEYVEWIVDAKRDETRDKRIATAVEWISEGKQRNWKYQNC